MIQDQVKILNFEVVLLVTYWAWILSLGIDDNCLNMNIYRKIDQLEFRDLWEMNFRYSKSYCKTKYFLDHNVVVFFFPSEIELVDHQVNLI